MESTGLYPMVEILLTLMVEHSQVDMRVLPRRLKINAVERDMMLPLRESKFGNDVEDDDSSV